MLLVFYYVRTVAYKLKFPLKKSQFEKNWALVNTMEFVIKSKRRTKKSNTKAPYPRRIPTNSPLLYKEQKMIETPVEEDIVLPKLDNMKEDLKVKSKEEALFVIKQKEEERPQEENKQAMQETASQKEEKYDQTEPKKMEYTALGSNSFLRKFSENIYYLQKGEHTIRLLKPELKQMLDLKPCISACMKDYLHGKKVKFTQNLGQDIYMSLQTPFRCIDVRKFWIVPGTEQLHPTRIGIPLNFTEYFNLIRVLEEKELA